MRNLLNFTRPELEAWVQDTLAQPPFRATQIWQWLWQKRVRSFDAMTNISRECRARLTQLAEIIWPKIANIQKSADGTTKFLLELEDGALIESVLIPSEDHEGRIRWAQCLSSQVGCAMGCGFCATGTMGFSRNLSMAEILGQVLVGRGYLNDQRPDHPILRNIVFMGMGEPLLNTLELMRALETLNSELGLNFSPRRITVSTCGIKGGIERIGQSGLAYLALSLHAPDQEVRSSIMPRAASWPLDELMAALQAYPLKTRERITFEYLLLRHINDSPQDARRLASLIAPLRGKVNLIAYNEVPGLPYQAPSPEQMEEFAKILRNKNITAILRKSKGVDIQGACGQLRAGLL